jgi:phosphoenolpyruvate carboxykinase (ATP)
MEFCRQLPGYTSKIAGTERGLGLEPKMTFSFGFGAPFLPQKPEIYIRLLLNRIKQHKTSVWLVNTGWVGGNYGTGKRIPLPVTRQLINLVVNNQLNEGEFIRENYFGLSIPKFVRGISQSILNPAMLWNNLIEYETTAARLKTQIDQQLLHYSPLLIRSISGSI